jgi:hypothetical protein
MQHMQGHLEKLRVQISECELIRDLATNKAKRELFNKLAEHYKVLAAEVEQAIAELKSGHRVMIQCQNPNCRARYTALLRNEAPPTAPICIECDMTLPTTIEGEFVYSILSPSQLN